MYRLDSTILRMIFINHILDLIGYNKFLYDCFYCFNNILVLKFDLQCLLRLQCMRIGNGGCSAPLAYIFIK